MVRSAELYWSISTVSGTAFFGGLGLLCVTNGECVFGLMNRDGCQIVCVFALFVCLSSPR